MARHIQALDTATGRWHEATLDNGVVSFIGWGKSYDIAVDKTEIRERQGLSNYGKSK